MISFSLFPNRKMIMMMMNLKKVVQQKRKKRVVKKRMMKALKVMSLMMKAIKKTKQIRVLI